MPPVKRKAHRKSLGKRALAALGVGALAAAGGPAIASSDPNFPSSGQFSNKTETSKKSTGNKFEDILDGVHKILKKIPKDEECCICMTELSDASGYADKPTAADRIVIKLKCNHMYHKTCLKAMYDSAAKVDHVQCPTCKHIYGVKSGNCPPGTMSYNVLNLRLPGYEDCGAIEIQYHIKSGTQGPEHPNPGKPFYLQGFPRIAYLPNNKEGRKVFKLLVKAWQRRLTFTVGQSVTSGANDCVTWNEIHHKTEVYDRSGHGYPAPKYLESVTEECNSLGIYDSDDDQPQDQDDGAESDESL